MKKSFPFHATGKADARVLDAIKHEVRKYVRREHKKPLPAGFDRLEFACKVGASAGDATAVALKGVSAAIDGVAQAGGSVVYIEVLALPAQRRSIWTGPR